jgi:hypothetical protein
MPYDPKIHSTQIISKKHKALLKKLAKKQRRSMQATLEILIEEAS